MTGDGPAPTDVLVPAWDAPACVRALVTTRGGGVSTGAYASLNLGDHVGDAADSVRRNRALLRALLPAEPAWLRQVHGTAVADAARVVPGTEADAVVAHGPGAVCAILTADCLPVLLCDRAGTVVAAAHAGWRGLAGGVLEAAVDAMGRAPGSLLAWLGPAIGPARFEVGDEVRAAFMAANRAAAAAFVAHRPGKWLGDLYALARLRLAAHGVTAVSGGGECTVSDATRWYSFRRDGATGRMASLIWLEPPGTGGVRRDRV